MPQLNRMNISDYILHECAAHTLASSHSSAVGRPLSIFSLRAARCVRCGAVPECLISLKTIACRYDDERYLCRVYGMCICESQFYLHQTNICTEFLHIFCSFLSFARAAPRFVSFSQLFTEFIVHVIKAFNSIRRCMQTVHFRRWNRRFAPRYEMSTLFVRLGYSRKKGLNDRNG